MKAIEKELDRMVQELHKNQRCHICGAYSATEIHHIISRKDKMLRYDITNLLPVCHACHMKIHDKGLDEYQFLDETHAEYLRQIKNQSYKDFLIFDVQMTEDEYLKQCKKTLKKQCKS